MKRFFFPVSFTALEAATAFHSNAGFIWLDSSKPDHPQGRYSYVLPQPSGDAPPHIIIPSDPEYPPFQGGWAGFKTYEGPQHFDFYTQVLSFDHLTGQAWFVTTVTDEKTAHLEYDAICSSVRRSRPVVASQGFDLDWTSNFTPSDYQDAVRHVIERILNGDIFQANLTQRFQAVPPPDFDAFAQYLTLRMVNPAPFSAYLNKDGYSISSASPEAFLSLSANGVVLTRPIKGTDRQPDRLKASEKDRAENIMIVDLLRSDLSQVCTDQSVEVTGLCEVQGFAGLYHLVSTIRGQVRAGVSPWDVLNACFPGGSITGAPKIEAMKILRELEKIPRGVYCGTIGWVGMDGAMETNIAIRTIVTTKDEISFGVGGGITALSNPEQEYQETLLKAEKIFQSYQPLRKNGTE